MKKQKNQKNQRPRATVVLAITGRYKNLSDVEKFLKLYVYTRLNDVYGSWVRVALDVRHDESSDEQGAYVSHIEATGLDDDDVALLSGVIDEAAEEALDVYTRE